MSCSEEPMDDPEAMRERLLLLSPFFHPEPISTGKYNTFLLQALIQNGFRADVICFHPIYPGWRPRRSNAAMAGARIFRGGAWARYPKNSLLRRFVLECVFGLHVLTHARRIKRYSRIVAVTPPMLFLPLLWIFAHRHTKVSTIVHDLQGIMAAVGVNSGRHSMIRLIRKLENLVLRCSHRVIALSDAMASFLSESYNIPRSKITVCRPFVTVEPRIAGNRIARLFARDKKHIVYAGGLGHKQCPGKLVAFLCHLARRRSDIVCHVFSGGPLFDDLRKDRQWKCRRLIFHDLVAESDLSELYLRSHIQIIPENPGLSEGAVPSKLPNLLATGVPILYVGEKDSDVWKLIQDCQAGMCCESWDFDRLSDLADRLLIECGRRTHTARRMLFTRNYAGLFSVDALIKELLIDT
jgi:colanic acid biosynthesis glycosyl transferase WcaI